jgi:hypothetical protein
MQFVQAYFNLFDGLAGDLPDGGQLWPREIHAPVKRPFCKRRAKLQPSATICNHPQPSATIRNHPQPSATSRNHLQPAATICNQPQPSATSRNQPQPAFRFQVSGFLLPFRGLSFCVILQPIIFIFLALLGVIRR